MRIYIEIKAKKSGINEWISGHKRSKGEMKEKRKANEYKMNRPIYY